VPAHGHRDPYKEQHWRETFARQKSSGLSKAQFCLSEGIKPSAFSNWERTIRDRDEEKRRANGKSKRQPGEGSGATSKAKFGSAPKASKQKAGDKPAFVKATVSDPLEISSPLIHSIFSERSSQAGEENRGSLKPHPVRDEVTDLFFERAFRQDFGGVRSLWEDIKRKAVLASMDAAGGGICAIESAMKNLRKTFTWHLVGHSAGGNFHAYFSKALVDAKQSIKTCTLWAPACSISVAQETYIPVIGENPGIERFTVYALTDQAEQEDDCGPYRKSILYLVSNALEPAGHRELLGMEKYSRSDTSIRTIFEAGSNADLIISPNNATAANPEMRSCSTSHGGFDDDTSTIQSTIARILASK
jgi:hypothetical protein